MTAPSKDNVNEKTLEALIIGAELTCLKCDANTSISFNPPINYSPEFIDQKSKLVCPECKNPYSSIPIFDDGMGNGNGDEKGDKEHLLSRVTKEDIRFLFDTMTKEAKYDVISIKQLGLGMFSAFTKIPIPHNCNSKNSGAGKSYLTNGVADYFPNQYVLVLVGASDKAFHHRQGTLVIKDMDTGELKKVQPMIECLEQQIEALDEKIGDDTSKESKKAYIKEIRKLEKEIKDLKNRAQKLVDLDTTYRKRSIIISQCQCS